MTTGLDSMVPDNRRFSINMHYQSETTHEFGTLRLNKSMTIDDVLFQYSRLFPIECRAFLETIQTTNQSLHRPGGMSKEGVVMAIGKIPKIVFLAIEFLNPDYFTDVRNFRNFVRAYPKFAVGDHAPKKVKGVLVK